MRKARAFSNTEDIRSGEDRRDGEDRRNHDMCVAHGCPLRGSISDSTQAGKDGRMDFRCWAHDRMNNMTGWPLLTKGIEDNLWMFRFADRVVGLPLMDLDGKTGELGVYAASMGRDDLSRKSGESRQSWALRIRQAAYDEASKRARVHGIRD